MIKLNLKRNENCFKNTESELLALFHASATGKSNKAFRFAKVDSNFAAFLPYLKDGAVKLYLYYAVVANNDTGESWYSHWHIYTEEYGRNYAFPAEDVQEDAFVDNTIAFLTKFNVVEQPNINYQLELL